MPQIGRMKRDLFLMKERIDKTSVVLFKKSARICQIRAVRVQPTL
jgi:hypothetical protein